MRILHIPKKSLNGITVNSLENELRNKIINKENIINEQINKNEIDNEYLEIEVVYEVLESIGIEDKILF